MDHVKSSCTHILCVITDFWCDIEGKQLSLHSGRRLLWSEYWTVHDGARGTGNASYSTQSVISDCGRGIAGTTSEDVVGVVVALVGNFLTFCCFFGLPDLVFPFSCRWDSAFLTLGAHAQRGLPYLVCVCVSLICRLTHWNHKREIPTD